MTICQTLAEQFPDLAPIFVERERLGMQRYGVPLDVCDGREWISESREELADAAVYLMAAFMREDCTARREKIADAAARTVEALRAIQAI